jgi:DnaK suppressor protein
MQIDVEKFRIILKQLEGELLMDLERSEQDAREAVSEEAGDPIDLVNSGESKDSSFDESSRDYDKLRLVREALARIDDGTFGKCVDCGREIPEARLEAVPWTPYCVEDQQKREPKVNPPTL